MAKDGEVTPLISTLSGIEPFVFLGSHESQVADPVIEAKLPPKGGGFAPPNWRQ